MNHLLRPSLMHLCMGPKFKAMEKKRKSKFAIFLDNSSGKYIKKSIWTFYNSYIKTMQYL
jgi:hypothetical protein